jgi:polyhydroxyalkanoate synthesis repressor PhaR
MARSFLVLRLHLAAQQSAPFFLCRIAVAFAAAPISREGRPMAEPEKPLLIKRYASRRLYNTETSDYVTLDEIAKFIRAGRDVQIVDLKSGDDLTRQYLLQIIADHESQGENVLPINVLTDLVRSYTTEVQSVVPQFLAASFEMLRNGQSKMLESFSNPLANPMSAMPGFEAMKAQQQAFMKAMTGNWQSGDAGRAEGGASQDGGGASSDDLDEIKRQLADLQSKLSKMSG